MGVVVNQQIRNENPTELVRDLLPRLDRIRSSVGWLLICSCSAAAHDDDENHDDDEGNENGNREKQTTNSLIFLLLDFRGFSFPTIHVVGVCELFTKEIT